MYRQSEHRHHHRTAQCRSRPPHASAHPAHLPPGACILVTRRDALFTQGAESVKQTNLEARFLFVAPPSIEELERRLRGRRTESEDKIKVRLQTARKELDFLASHHGFFDLVIGERPASNSPRKDDCTRHSWPIAGLRRCCHLDTCSCAAGFAQ